MHSRVICVARKLHLFEAVDTPKYKAGWLDILALSAAVACLVALLLAAFGAGAASFLGEPAFAQSSGESPNHSDQVFEGMLTCSRCGARHSANSGKNAADCVRMCAHLGAAFSLIQADKVYQLKGDGTELKPLAARRVRVAGRLDGDTIEIGSIAASD